MTEADQDEPEDIEVRMTAALKRALATRFGIDDLGETIYTLGLEVRRDSASGRLLLSTKPTPHKPKDRPDERKPAKG